MQRDGVSLDEIYDVLAFRIIVDGGAADVYSALGIVHALWRPVPGRFKDYVALPKAYGSQSLHTTVIGAYGERMEVQSRTVEMHRDAELGIAAHWKYKSGKVAADDDVGKFAWLRQLVERHQDVVDPDEFLETVKIDLVPDEVFVFTPRGDVIGLPVGATPVDFAYAIHSEVGDACAGAKVNGKLVSLRHHLVDGDTVEVLTHSRQLPRKDWLDFVVTGKARSRIRHAIRAEEKARSRELGREILDREFRKAGLSLPRALEGEKLGDLARSHGRGSIDDLMAAVGYGRISAAELVRGFKGEDAPAPEPKTSRRRLFGRSKEPSTGLQVGGQSDVLVRFGGCCAPLPGDEVIGFVTRGRGVTVHSKDCPKAFELDPERRIDVEWHPEAEVTRKIKMRVRSQDTPGLLAKVTKTIAAEGVNIGGARVVTRPDSLAEQTFDVWVPDAAKLNAVMREIRKIKGVLSVERLRT
jgi:GTP pyrophosphokinase